MKKLLLLTTLPLATFLSSFAGMQGGSTERPLNDSTIKKDLPADPKAGFRDLFQGASAESDAYNVQLNPKAVSFVEDYIDVYTKKLNNMKSWGKPYFDLIDGVLGAHNLPTELKYLAVIESELKTSATSWVGAAGPWQFMPQTARELGLRVTRKTDERRDYKKSTVAAARYLKSLYSEFNDWLLVIAAYNGGPGNVNQAIRKSGSRNFWELQYHLPAESRNHVKKFIATHYIMEGDGSVTTMTKSERAVHANYTSGFTPAATTAAVSASGDVATERISGKFNGTVLAQMIGMDLGTFNRLNPSFDKQMAQSGTYELRLPADKMQAFQANKFGILEQSVKVALTLAGR
ncbi:lytic transglycosylase domain-containing protein [Flaviaesturariibacter amylovorans]|uniref:Transglycosylase SLT domain-containing protein n=1 Tax=Flaviaesturariibacter amylovorans TaxID=1084520 RepID=A0ABP8H9I6_9BACT